MPRIVRAEYLSYYSSARNSDKLFNVFLIINDDNTYTCVTENGRRGSKLVLRTLCEKVRREIAEQKMWRKVSEKRNHGSTPYQDESFGFNYSQIVKDIGFNQSNFNSFPTTDQSENSIDVKSNVIEFPTSNAKKPSKSKRHGILNTEQLESLEI